jgi:hypothetical protein
VLATVQRGKPTVREPVVTCRLQHLIVARVATVVPQGRLVSQVYAVDVRREEHRAQEHAVTLRATTQIAVGAERSVRRVSSV